MAETRQRVSIVSRVTSSRRAVCFDVVFYTPWIGSILTSGEALPPGGAETQVFALARALAERGVRVAIIAYNLAGDLPDEVDGVKIIPRPPHRPRGKIVGKACETFLIWRALARAPSQFVVRRGGGVDVGVIGAFTKATGRRLVFSSANVVDFSYWKLLPKWWDLGIYRYGVRTADAIVVQTAEQVSMCERAFGRRPKLIKSIANPAQSTCVAPEAFLWVGRIVSYKRPLEYLALARAMPDARFWMLGVPTPHGEDGRQLVERVLAEAKQLPNVELLAPCSNDQVGALMARAVASVNTADFEGMPNVLLEAWTRGVPALVLNHDPDGAVTRYRLGGFAGGSPGKFVRLARDLWENRDERADLSRRCLAYITENHSSTAIAGQWLEVLGIPAGTHQAQTREPELERICAE